MTPGQERGIDPRCSGFSIGISSYPAADRLIKTGRPRSLAFSALEIPFLGVTRVQGGFFRECHDGSSDSSPAVPKCNPSLSDLSRYPDRECYRRESRHLPDCSAHKIRLVVRLCAKSRLQPAQRAVVRDWIEKVARHGADFINSFNEEAFSALGRDLASE